MGTVQRACTIPQIFNERSNTTYLREIHVIHFSQRAAILLLAAAVWGQTPGGPIPFSQLDPVRRTVDVSMIQAAEAHAAEVQRRQAMENEKRIFEQKFNRLAIALRRFADEYNNDHGNVWPLREAQALQEACRNLQRSPFFGKRPAVHQNTLTTRLGNSQVEHESGQ